VDSSEKSGSGRRQTKDAGFSNTGFTQWILKSIQQDPHQEEAVLPTKEMAPRSTALFQHNPDLIGVLCDGALLGAL